MKPTDLTLAGLAASLGRKELSSLEATQACLERIEATDPKIGAFLHVDAEGALAQARASDERRAMGASLGPLDGVPVALKDIFCTKGIPTTCGSKILEGFVPPFDSSHVIRLAQAGAVMVGKLNMDEFAMGSSNETSAYGPCRNPWDLERTPGGSSGGSAAAVAARQVFGTLGTDTGGSIRQPAAFSGVTGIKPTYGRCSRYGVIAFASSLDQVGPFGRTAEDCALLLQAIAGRDPMDSTSLDVPVPDWASGLSSASVKGMRLGVPKEYFVEGVDPEVEAAVRAAMKRLEELGAELVPVELPHTEYGISTYYVVAPAECSSNLARFDGVRYGLSERQEGGLREMYFRTRAGGFGPEVKRRIMIGTWALSSGYYDAYYLRAQKVRTLIKRDFEEAFRKVDAIVTPTTPTAAFRLGERADDPLQMYLADVFTLACNLAGLPGMSLPCGFTSGGLPIGMQLLGKPLDEATLFRVGAAYQAVTDWHERAPQEVA
ncbi:Asp-tRNA(Asn)/Glu-tRNA(Gln) amidotransferase subunit GatA [Vulgatibacter incomptus]|uniref:Glutamyl-tRNA(Gln) amidotransferase subunit A n=1 Tax=Vulgatibacter incomptus TaxID=1391653 RepID=A0A0K1PII1_9BACT|nr:Asp-tRNA(Asn)/Glu-tRNA(Gln) amidotransferase subunit GatA [Vulgatibacter incomptus]AKU93317.1 Aspartyl-tRNA(Asn) amidotransferase subunit A [Vulgatibacter incomptus]